MALPYRAAVLGLLASLVSAACDSSDSDPLDAMAECVASGALGESCAPATPTMDASVSIDAAMVPADAQPVDSAPAPVDAALADARQGPARPPDDAGQVGPCGYEPEYRRVYNLCVWTTDADLARIHADPEARIEIPASVSLGGFRYEDVEFEIHGGSARLWPKKSYRLRFRAKPRPAYDWFGSGEDKIERIVLQGAWIDPTFVRNKLIFDALNEVGAMAPRLGYARVYINGRLNGLYQVIERVDEHFLERYELDRMGNLYKAEQAGADFRWRENPLLGIQEVTNEDGKADDLYDLFKAIFETPQTYAAYQQQIANRVSLDDFDLFNIVMTYTLNLDTFIKNYYLYHDPNATDPRRGSIFRIIHWDADASYGIGWNEPRYDDPERAALWSQVDSELQDNVLAQRMYAIPEYRAAYLDRYEALVRGPLSAARLTARAEALMKELENDIQNDLVQWKRDRYFDVERDFLKQMIALRERVALKAIADTRAAPIPPAP